MASYASQSSQALSTMALSTGPTSVGEDAITSCRAKGEAGCWRPGFWVPSLLLVAPFMRWARRHWSVPPPVLRERLARRAAVRRPARRAAGPPVFWARRGVLGPAAGGSGRAVLPFFAVFLPLFSTGGCAPLSPTH